jgi:hypothetical protein
MSTNYQHSLLQAILCSIGDLVPTSKTECGKYDISGIAKPGDHIAVRTVYYNKPDVIWHHGIYMGDCRVVYMHPITGNISNVRLSEFAVLQLHLDDMYDDMYVDKTAIVVYEGDNPQLKALTMLIASNASNTNKEIEYDDFASWCRTGRCDGAYVTKLLCK